ncbi:glycosyltransferase family 4 protein [Ructibacterium gallinarum]|uniref:Glycosyltransferase family 4 protein n=1 Tax=Ructibacterium gallinarum TaxID=2779355 RepID=A0A9D5LZA4_9FIRM|nr:glycosyltransferase family 4 protein [Ructibacterium gallinarum]MBE5039345.1 glycosyltransferase family 4 protein [Ructibacterium gallinarum]
MNRKIVILINHNVTIYNMRKELVERLVSDGYEVYLSCPYGDRISQLSSMGCHFIETNYQRHGKNMIADFKLFLKYKGIIKKIRPGFVLTYTVKPNIYGGMAASFCHVPCIANITGLGTAVENPGILRWLVLSLYKFALRKDVCVFFQNMENEVFFQKHNIALGRHRLIPGSGVNLIQYRFLDYPQKDTIEFVFISRIMKDKGIEEYLQAAKYLTKKYPAVRFHICGFCEEAYQGRLESLSRANVICYHGMVQDVREVLQEVHCLVHPSYHEGMSNAVLEASACGRPCLCSDIAGCREIVEEGMTGFLFPPGDTEALIAAIERFLQLPVEIQKKMGENARKKVAREFDRNIVVEAYMEEINKCLSEEKL